MEYGEWGAEIAKTKWKRAGTHTHSVLKHIAMHSLFAVAFFTHYANGIYLWMKCGIHLVAGCYLLLLPLHNSNIFILTSVACTHWASHIECHWLITITTDANKRNQLRAHRRKTRDKNENLKKKRMRVCWLRELCACAYLRFYASTLRGDVG